MPSILVVLAGVLIGTDTGLQMHRAAGGSPPVLGAAAYFPTLSVTAALLTGMALSEVALLAPLEHFPELASYIAGPLLAIFGFVWFQGGVLEHRLRPVRADGTPPTEQDWMPASGKPLRSQIGLGIRMGVLLSAAGVRTVATLTLSILAAIAVAAATPETLRSFSSPRVALPTLVRIATGGLLCALGIGTEVERLTRGAVPALEVALALAVFAWSACAIALWRSPNH